MLVSNRANVNMICWLSFSLRLSCLHSNYWVNANVVQILHVKDLSDTFIMGNRFRYAQSIEHFDRQIYDSTHGYFNRRMGAKLIWLHNYRCDHRWSDGSANVPSGNITQNRTLSFEWYIELEPRLPFDLTVLACWWQCMKSELLFMTQKFTADSKQWHWRCAFNEIMNYWAISLLFGALAWTRFAKISFYHVVRHFAVEQHEMAIDLAFGSNANSNRNNSLNRNFHRTMCVSRDVVPCFRFSGIFHSDRSQMVNTRCTSLHITKPGPWIGALLCSPPWITLQMTRACLGLHTLFACAHTHPFFISIYIQMAANDITFCYYFRLWARMERRLAQFQVCWAVAEGTRNEAIACGFLWMPPEIRMKIATQNRTLFFTHVIAMGIFANGFRTLIKLLYLLRVEIMVAIRLK